MPVLSLTGTDVGINEEGQEIFEGKVTLFSGFDPTFDDLSVQSSTAQWHVRGASSARYIFEKKSYKINLKDENGNNNDLNFLGMGSDDDWIINSMVMDDTKLREKFFMDFWNSFLEFKNINYRMSCGEYAEIIINGKYQGLYLIQRRVDEKYLDLDEEDILIKGSNVYVVDGDYIYAVYEIKLVSSPFDLEKSENIFFRILDYQDGGEIAQDDFISKPISELLRCP